MKPATLLRLYPRKWREKYGEEFLALLHAAPIRFRTIGDVASAAATERARASMPAMMLFVFVYALLWISFAMLGAVIPKPFPSLFSLADHARAFGMFALAAIVSRVVDTNVFGASGLPRSKTAAHTIDFLSYTFAFVLVWSASTLMPHVVLHMPAALIPLMTGIKIGHRPAMRQLLAQVPEFPPRPPSFTRLGLSA